MPRPTRSSTRALLGLTLGVLFLSAGPDRIDTAEAAVLEVFPDGSGTYANLQQAVLAAGTGDTIQLADGLFTGAGNRNVTLRGPSLTLRSAGGTPEACILDSEGDGRALFVQSLPGTAIRIEGITLRGGNPSLLPPELLGGFGGGLAVQGVAPSGTTTVTRCIFEDQRAEAGAGAFVYQARAEFRACTFRRNAATDGAGAYCGYCNEGAGVTFQECVFHENEYPDPGIGGYGAGIYYSHSRGGVEGCTLTDNRAWIGAGILVSTASVVQAGGTLIAFCPEGQGLAIHGGTASVERCDIYGNQGGDWVGPIADLLGLDCNVTADPFFCDAAAGDFTLRGDSPCLPENSGGCGLIGARPQGCPPVASAVGGVGGTFVEREPCGNSAAPGRESLACYPNPGRAAVTIAYEVAQAGPVNLGLFAADGRHVATLVETRAAAGRQRLTDWRPADEHGQRLPAGLYFLRLETAAGRASRPVILAP